MGSLATLQVISYCNYCVELKFLTQKLIFICEYIECMMAIFICELSLCYVITMICLPSIRIMFWISNVMIASEDGFCIKWQMSNNIRNMGHIESTPQALWI